MQRDDKYFYIQQRFVSAGKVHSIANLKGLFVHKRKVLSTDALLELTGTEKQSPTMPQYIKHWQEMLAAKKDNR